MNEFVQRECRPLMDACTSNLYKTNSFRVLGVSVDATSREIKRRMDELKLAVEMCDLEEEYTHALLPYPLPDMDDLQRATKRLQDPQTRFVDEFFWFWPLRWEESSNDQALQVLANGDRSAAETIWTEHLTGYPEAERLAATHNLAVLYHILAIDMEHDCHKNETPLLPSELELLNTFWRTSFDWWEKLVDHEGFWDLLRERVLAINDPSLSTGFVRRFRAMFPIAFDNINADFAAIHSKKGKHSRAALHIQFMQETHDGLDDVDASLTKVTHPLHSRIDAALNRATENLHDNPKDGMNRAERLLAETEEPLKALSTLLGVGHAEVTETQDEVVEACCNCAIAYGNETEEWAGGARLLEKIKGLATSSELISRIEKNLETVRRNESFGELAPISSAPSLRTVNGIGMALYGATNRDSLSGSYLSTYYFVFFAIPIFPICRYRVIPTMNGYRFLGKAPLRTFDKWHLAISIGLIIWLILAATVDGSGSSSSYRPISYPSSSSSSKPTSYSTSDSSSEPWNSYSGYSSSSTRSALGQEIDKEKARAKQFEQTISAADLEIESLETRMNSYTSWNTAEYNRLVPVINQMVSDRNKVYEEYKRLIESVNAKVRKYNAM